MKLKLGVYPDFWQVPEQIVEEKYPELFVARKHDLYTLWDTLALRTRGAPTHIAIASQRRLGKTSVLSRFYNVAFNEQEEIIPLYYSFSSSKRLLAEVANEMVLTFCVQSLSFESKTRDLLEVVNIDALKMELEAAPTDINLQVLKIVKNYELQRDKSSGARIIEVAFDVANAINRKFKKPMLIIIDEVPRLSTHLLDNERNHCSCKGAFGVLISLMNRNLIMLSGSQMHMIQDDIQLTFNGHVRPDGVSPLREEEVVELVQKSVRNFGHKGYLGIEKDVYQLVGGNPFYTICIFEQSSTYRRLFDQNKNIDCREELLKIFNFETGHEKGSMFAFWNAHFQENADLLNRDEPKNKGLTLRMLQYIANKEGVHVKFDELAKKFHVSMSVVEKKMEQLRKTDLIEIRNIYAVGLPDRVLALILLRSKYEYLLDNPSEQKAQEEINKILAERLNLLENRMGSVEKGVSRKRGQENLADGLDFEIKVRDGIVAAITAGTGKFREMKLVGDMNSINLYSKSRNKLSQLDGFAIVEKARGKSKQTIGLVITVKNMGRKVSVGDVRKFLDAFAVLKREKNLRSAQGIFVSSSSFTKGALELLAKNKVWFGTPKDLAI